MSAWKKLWRNTWVKKISHAVLGQLPDVGAGGLQPLVMSLMGTPWMRSITITLGAAIVPVDLRHVEQVRAGEVALQLRGVGGLAHQIELVEDGLLVLVHHLERPQAPAFRPVAVGEPGERMQHLEIASDDGAHAGTQHLDHHLAPVLQPRGMHLRDRGGRERRLLELREHRGDAAAVGALDQWRAPSHPGNGGTRSCSLASSSAMSGGKQIAPRRERLAELDEDRAELLERQAQPLAAVGTAAALRTRSTGDR